MERKLLHQVGHPPQNVSDIAKQIVGLAGHSASPHSTALVLPMFRLRQHGSGLMCRLESSYFVPHILNADGLDMENPR